MTDRPPPATAQPLDLSIVVGAATDPGGRAGNEDAIHVAELATLPPVPGAAAPAQTFLLAVADGMGGHADGEVASRLAIEALVAAVGNEPGPDAALLFKQAFRRANEAIYAAGGGAADARSMGTTLVAALLRGKYATIASVGDSRAYLLRAGAMTQVTKDHTLVAEQVAKGAITAEQARRSPQRNVLTQALGTAPKLDSKLPGVFELTLLPEDRLLLCTDGFYDVLSDAEMAEVLRAHPAPDAARRLVDLAKERGTSDNVSAVVAAAVPTRVPTVTLEPAAAGGRGPNPVLLLIVALVVVALAVGALLLVGGF